MTTRQQLRRMLPFPLIALGLWLIGGCFYLPVPEHQAVYDKSKDFRPLVGISGSDHPLQPGVTRARVQQLLGPSIQVDKHQSIYLMTAVRAAWVYPLCFYAKSAKDRNYVLRLTYDDAGNLRRWEMAYADVSSDWLNGPYDSGWTAALGALEKTGAVSSDSGAQSRSK